MIDYDLLARHGMHVIGVFHSETEKLKSYMEAEDVPFPIIAVPDMTLYKLYRVESSLMGVGRGLFRVGDLLKMMSGGYLKIKPYDVSATVLPADILIDPRGIIRNAYYGKDIGDHLPLETVREFAEEYASV